MATKQVDDEPLTLEEQVKLGREKLAKLTGAATESAPPKLDLSLVKWKCSLAPHAARLLVDQRAFYHGGVYDVLAYQVPSLDEMAARTWDHEAEVNATDPNWARRQLNLRDYQRGGQVFNAPGEHNTISPHKPAPVINHAGNFR